MLNFTARQELDFHRAYHRTMKADSCKHCNPIFQITQGVIQIMVDDVLSSLQRGERAGDVVPMGVALPAAEMRVSGTKTGGPHYTFTSEPHGVPATTPGGAGLDAGTTSSEPTPSSVRAGGGGGS